MAFGSVRFRGGAPKRFNKISIRTSWKVILNHPFFVATVLYLIILHRYFPLLFSLLVSASPVLICTALLLGILLIHGQQQHHRIVNVSERNVDDGSIVADSSNNGVGDFTYSVDKDGLFSVDRFGEMQNDLFRREVAVSREFESRGKTIDDFRRLSQRSNQTDSDKEGLQFGDFGFKNVQTHDLHAPNFDEKYDKTAYGRHDSAFSSQKHVDSATNHESSYSESDGAEKFSLDVLVAEVTPTPQETHPLLGSEDPRHLRTSRAASFKSETQSLDSMQSSENSDEEEEDEKGDDVENDETPKAIDGDSPSPFAWTENDQRILQELRNSEMEKNEHLESLIARAEDDESEEHEESNDDADDEDDDVDVDVDVDVDDDDDDDDENVDSEKDVGKQVTLWTEEDEKNLRHLGCSELERNLRLENLLARRRAKRNFSMISERNLIDLDKFVLPSPVPPISTTRVNPFDNSDDTSHHSNAPPIPGSAPSVTLPRKNPFDSPCTSPKRAQNLGLESVKESSVDINLKNTASHENGSSSTGYNTIGHVSKPENRKESLFRRYESFSSGFNVTEDSSSADDFVEFDRKNFVFRRHETFNTRTPFPSFFNPKKPVFVPEQVGGEEWHPSLDRQLSQDTESVESGTSSDTELSTAPDNHEYVEHELEDQEANNEGDHTSAIHMETGSESSEAINSHYSDQDEHNVENMEMNEDHVYQNQEVFHDGHDDHDDTSSSSASEHDAENESQTKQEQVEISAISSNKSLTMSEASHVSTDDDHLPVEPVYDTSPSGAEKITAFTNPSEVEMK